MVSYLHDIYRMSEPRVVRISVSSFRYEIRQRISEIAQVRVRYDYRKIRIINNADRLLAAPEANRQCARRLVPRNFTG